MGIIGLWGLLIGGGFGLRIKDNEMRMIKMGKEREKEFELKRFER